MQTFGYSWLVPLNKNLGLQLMVQKIHSENLDKLAFSKVVPTTVPGSEGAFQPEPNQGICFLFLSNLC